MWVDMFLSRPESRCLMNLTNFNNKDIIFTNCSIQYTTEYLKSKILKMKLIK